MAKRLAYPIRLAANHAIGTDANGKTIEFTDALKPGERVGPGDSRGNVFCDAVVVERDGGLWVDEVSEATIKAWAEETMRRANEYAADLARELGLPVNGETTNE